MDNYSSSSNDGEIPVQNDIWFITDTFDNPRSMANTSEEDERLRSGYYLDMRQSLDICMQHYDDAENPFYKVEIGALKYLNGITNNQNMFHSDKLSSHHSSSIAESVPVCSTSFEQLYKQVFDEQSFSPSNRCDEISGIFSLSQSTSNNTTLTDLENHLPDTMDNVLNELSSMESEELAKLINNPSSNESPFSCNSIDQLLCHETMHVSSSSNSSKKRDSAKCTIQSQPKTETRRPQRRLNKRNWKKTINAVETESDFDRLKTSRSSSVTKVYDSAGNAIPLAILENKTIQQMVQTLKKYKSSDASA